MIVFGINMEIILIKMCFPTDVLNTTIFSLTTKWLFDHGVDNIVGEERKFIIGAQKIFRI